jgi:hypothetical protein
VAAGGRAKTRHGRENSNKTGMIFIQNLLRKLHERYGFWVIRKYGKWGRGGQKIIHDQG